MLVRLVHLASHEHALQARSTRADFEYLSMWIVSSHHLQPPAIHIPCTGSDSSLSKLWGLEELRLAADAIQCLLAIAKALCTEASMGINRLHGSLTAATNYPDALLLNVRMMGQQLISFTISL